MSVRLGLVLGIVLVVVIVAFVLIGVYGDNFANFSGSLESSNSSANPTSGNTDASATTTRSVHGGGVVDENHPRIVARNKVIHSVTRYLDTPDLYSVLNQTEFLKHREIQRKFVPAPKKEKATLKERWKAWRAHSNQK